MSWLWSCREGQAMSLDVVWNELLEFNDKYFPGWRDTPEIYYSNAIAGEAGEVCNCVKHRAGGGTNKSNPSDLELLEELADVFIYIELLIVSKNLSNATFASIIREKIKINEIRMKYSSNNEEVPA